MRASALQWRISEPSRGRRVYLSQTRKDCDMARSIDNPDELYRTRSEPHNPQVTLSATEARQGSWGRPVFYVLVVGLILAMFAWWAAENYGERIAPPQTDQTTSSVTKDPAADQTVIDNTQPKGEPMQTVPAIKDPNKL
jgi:hypothetical protein